MTLAGVILDFVRRHRRAYLASALMLVGVAVLTVWVPRKVGQIVDGLVAGTLDGRALGLELAALLAMGLTIYALRVGWRLELFAAAFQLGVELRTRLYRRLCAHGPSFFQRQRTGDLMALATNDIDAVELSAGEALLAGFDGTLTLVLVIAAMTVGLDLRLALFALLPFPFMAWAFAVIARRLHVASRAALDRFGEINDHVQETLAGVRTVRSLGLEPLAGEEFARRTAAAAAAGLEGQRWEAAFEPVVGLSLAAAMTLILGVGSWQVLAGELTLGQLTAFTMYLGQLIWPMFAAGWVVSLLERGAAAWSRLQPVLDAPDSLEDTGALDAVPAGAALVLERVSYTYPGAAAPALQEVSLTVEPGRTVAVVGPTGAGKSTLLALVLRHARPTTGAIRWGEAPLEAYRLDALRRATNWVPQEAFLFSASIAENIALGQPGASRAEIEAAARIAALHDDVVRLPQAYDTLTGERGYALSGGQRQRVALARALLAPAPLLLLDDTLSAVDTGTEARILEHLRRSRAEAGAARATLVVSHRLSAVADADQIVVLRMGRITERGTHAQLLALDGWYARQWRYQQLEASLDAA